MRSNNRAGSFLVDPSTPVREVARPSYGSGHVHSLRWAPPASIVMVTTAPPTSCGIATFGSSLATVLRDEGHRVNVMRVLTSDESGDGDGPDVVGHWRRGHQRQLPEIAATLNRSDVVFVQHEYGLFGGDDGDELLGLLPMIDVPVVVVVHTVLSSPSNHQRETLNRVMAHADAVVVMTERARALLGPGKGLEWAIDALADVVDVFPRIRYVIAGRTHPRVLANDGEAYRNSLVQRAQRAGVTHRVIFDNLYRDVPALGRLIALADAVILPYDSTDQATSGVLVDAVCAGRPVIATAFPHAIELLASGAGIVVPQRDPSSIAAAMRLLATSPDTLATMTNEARRLAPSMTWESVGRQYHSLADAVMRGANVRVTNVPAAVGPWS